MSKTLSGQSFIMMDATVVLSVSTVNGMIRETNVLNSVISPTCLGVQTYLNHVGDPSTLWHLNVTKYLLVQKLCM